MENETKNPVLNIGIMANILGIHQRTLRIYDKNQILMPMRTIANRRLYSFADIEKAKLILHLTRNLALNLSGVKIVLGLLEKLKIEPKESLKLLNAIALEKEIDEISNLKMTSKRGRKPKNKSNV